MQVELVARGPQKTDLMGIGHTRAPHAGACGKDLHGVAAQFSGGLQGVQVAPGNGGMNTDANPPIHPGRRQRFGLRFGAIFVFGIELCRYSDALFFGHAYRDFGSVINSLF